MTPVTRVDAVHARSVGRPRETVRQGQIVVDHLDLARRERGTAARSDEDADMLIVPITIATGRVGLAVVEPAVGVFEEGRTGMRASHRVRRARAGRGPRRAGRRPRSARRLRPSVEVERLIDADRVVVPQRADQHVAGEDVDPQQPLGRSSHTGPSARRKTRSVAGVAIIAITLVRVADSSCRRTDLRTSATRQLEASPPSEIGAKFGRSDHNPPRYVRLSELFWHPPSRAARCGGPGERLA